MVDIGDGRGGGGEGAYFRDLFFYPFNENGQNILWIPGEVFQWFLVFKINIKFLHDFFPPVVLYQVIENVCFFLQNFDLGDLFFIQFV